jgi:uncharacterized heparinase superfamily protein
LSLKQIAYRLHYIIRRRWWKLTKARAKNDYDAEFLFPKPLYTGCEATAADPSQASETAQEKARTEAMSAGLFCFLNREVQFGERLGWHDKNLSQLWRYQLHYFSYVETLLAASPGARNQTYETFKRIARSWIRENQTILGDGWHPYTLSLRIINWLHSAAGFPGEFAADQAFCKEFIGSLKAQVQVLAKSLEFDVRGNHLLENLRALIHAGCSLRGELPATWARKAMAILREELAEQVLPDGCHFERSPGYHVTMLRGLLETSIWLRRNTGTVPAWLDAAVRLMCDYLLKFLPRDGAVPLLKDTSWDIITKPESVLAVAAVYYDEPAYKRTAQYPFPASLMFGAEGRQRFDSYSLADGHSSSLAPGPGGFAVLRDATDYMVVDVGVPCPEYLPAHAHADMLSFELAVGGRRVVVDSGVFEYQAGPWRDFFRSTRAHNTVEVEGENQSEVWGGFRVARRARPLNVSWQETAEEVTLGAGHDGYCRLAARAIHARKVVWKKGHFWLVWDRVQALRPVKAASQLHFHPDISLRQECQDCWRIEGAVEDLFLSAVGHDGFRLERGQELPRLQGWYAERFGELRANLALSFLQQAPKRDCVFIYAISRRQPARLNPRGTRLEVEHSGQRWEIDARHEIENQA